MFKVGDEVMLKSGGPKMLVKRIDSEKQVSCQWFGGRGGCSVKEGEFHVDCLVPYPNELKNAKV